MGVGTFSRAAGKLAPYSVGSQAPGGGLLGSNQTSLSSQLIVQCQVVEVRIGGVVVSSLLVPGSMVTTITQAFFKQPLKP